MKSGIERRLEVSSIVWLDLIELPFGIHVYDAVSDFFEIVSVDEQLVTFARVSSGSIPCAPFSKSLFALFLANKLESHIQAVQQLGYASRLRRRKDPK
jgi:hypothetical protein